MPSTLPVQLIRQSLESVIRLVLRIVSMLFGVLLCQLGSRPRGSPPLRACTYTLRNSICALVRAILGKCFLAVGCLAVRLRIRTWEGPPDLGQMFVRGPLCHEGLLHWHLSQADRAAASFDGYDKGSVADVHETAGGSHGTRLRDEISDGSNGYKLEEDRMSMVPAMLLKALCIPVLLATVAWSLPAFPGAEGKDLLEP